MISKINDEYQDRFQTSSHFIQIYCTSVKSHSQGWRIPADEMSPYMEGHLIEFEHLIKKSREGYIMDYIVLLLVFPQAAAATRFLEDSTPLPPQFTHGLFHTIFLF